MVRIVLSALCKVLEAAFDINGTQFTFHCRPYYLRLKFNEELTEGKGEKATYDLESNTLTVFLPKAVHGQPFTQLDNPAYLIATDVQRKRLISVVGVEEHAEHEAQEEEEVEFVQSLATAESTAAEGSAVHYGFANHFSGLFARLDEDIVREMVEVPKPETTSAAQRRAMRLQAENAAFSEEAVLLCFEDADGEVAEVLRYVPAHVRDFQAALAGDGVVYASLPQSLHRAEEEELEEEGAVLAAGDEGEVSVWRGNIAEFRRPLVEEVSSAEAPSLPAATAAGADAPVLPHPVPSIPLTRLAVPKTRPQLVFTVEETDALMRFKAPRLLFPLSPAAVAALTADLLLAEAYDDLVTEGQGCSESLWNLTKLSPALSYLDPADTVYEACVAFARRTLVYPLHRHFGLVQRTFAVAGTRLLLGRQYVVRALLRVRRVLAHAEHKHVLASIFLDPLIAYWMNVSDADERLMQLALEMHDNVTRTQPVLVRAAKQPRGDAGGGSGSLFRVVDEAPQKTLEPITLLTLGLPFEV